MTARPALTAKSSQKVLHYLLSQPGLLVKSWRSRIYNYSSATWLKFAGTGLIEWVNEPDTPQLHKHRVSCLTKLTDEENLYQLVGDAIFEFIKTKHLPFPHALLSQRHYREVPSWKRSMIFVFLLRVVLQLKMPKQWKNYTPKDYKFNIRAFRYRFGWFAVHFLYSLFVRLFVCLFYRSYLRLDRVITERSAELKKIPADCEMSPLRRVKKQTDATSPSASESATVFYVLTSSEDEDPNEDDEQEKDDDEKDDEINV